MVEFRRSLAASFLFRFFMLSSYQLAADADTFQHSIPDSYKSAVKVSARPCRLLCAPLDRAHTLGPGSHSHRWPGRTPVPSSQFWVIP